MTSGIFFPVADQERGQMNQLMRLFPREDIERGRKDNCIKPLNKILRQRVARVAAEHARAQHNGAWKRAKTLEHGAMGSLRGILLGSTRRMDDAPWASIAYAIDVVANEGIPELDQPLPTNLLGPEMPAATSEPLSDNGNSRVFVFALRAAASEDEIDWAGVEAIVNLRKEVGR